MLEGAVWHPIVEWYRPFCQRRLKEKQVERSVRNCDIWVPLPLQHPQWWAEAPVGKKLAPKYKALKSKVLFPETLRTLTEMWLPLSDSTLLLPYNSITKWYYISEMSLLLAFFPLYFIWIWCPTIKSLLGTCLSSSCCNNIPEVG